MSELKEMREEFGPVVGTAMNIYVVLCLGGAVVMVLGMLLALVLGGGTDTPTAQPDGADAACVDVRAAADEVASDIGPMPKQEDFRSPPMPVFDGSEEERQAVERERARRGDYEAYVKATDAWRYNTTVMLQMITSQPHCYAAKSVAQAQTALNVALTR